MSIDKLNEEKFDKMLRWTLQASSQPSPAYFTDRVLKQVRAVEEQKILARVVWQERLALAGCIAVAIAGIAAAVKFAAIDGGFTPTVQLLIYQTALAVKTFSSQWHLYAFCAGVFVLIGYGLIDLLVSE
jgi:hypothetical protein